VLEKEIFDLERALESNREIGVAMGILMAREMCTQSQAFNRLRTASPAAEPQTS
jgi:AmiR/NasT family two-component response regulator